MESLKSILTKMKSQIKDSKDAEEKAKSSSASLQKQVDSLNKKLAEGPRAILTPKETAESAAAVEKKDDGAQPVETMPAEVPAVDATEAADARAQAAKSDTEVKAAVADTAIKKKGKKRKGDLQKNAAADSTTAPPLKKPTNATEQKDDSATDKEVATPPTASVVTAVDENKTASAERNTATSEAATAASQAKSTPAVEETKQAPTAPTQPKPVEQQKKALPPKKMIKLTKTTQVQKQDTTKDASTSTSPKKDAATPKKDTASATGTKEEEMKKKMLLLKKRKAQMELKMKASAKQKLEAKLTSAPGKDESDKSSGVDDEKNKSNSTEKTADPVSPKPLTTKPSTVSKPLPPVPENDEPVSEQDKKAPSNSADEKSPSETVAAPATLTFGSSTTVTGFGVPVVAPLQPEPNCPKPSFFGTSATAPTSVFGSGTTPVFGSTTTPGFGFGAKKTDEKTESPDATVKQTSQSGGAFLNLTPPGKTAKPSQFVFGKSSNITLPVPAPSPFGVFNQNNQKATPFSAFNINPPFGGGTGFGSAPEDKSEDSKTEKTSEEGEVKEDEGTSSQKDTAAKEA